MEYRSKLSWPRRAAQHPSPCHSRLWLPFNLRWFVRAHCPHFISGLCLSRDVRSYQGQWRRRRKKKKQPTTVAHHVQWSLASLSLYRPRCQSRWRPLAKSWSNNGWEVWRRTAARPERCAKHNGGRGRRQPVSQPEDSMNGLINAPVGLSKRCDLACNHLWSSKRASEAEGGRGGGGSDLMWCDKRGQCYLLCGTGGRQRGGGIKESATGLNVEVVPEIRRTFPLTDETFPFSLFCRFTKFCPDWFCLVLCLTKCCRMRLRPPSSSNRKCYRPNCLHDIDPPSSWNNWKIIFLQGGTYQEGSWNYEKKKKLRYPCINKNIG